MTDGLHTRWALELMRGLFASGVGFAVVSPGSRSTPLSLAAVEVFGAATSVVVDERSAAFVALGFARASGVPAVMIVTSGSAGAHAFPAVIEAELAGVPLIILTADRAIELFEAGAPQTIDQNQLFGRHVRAAFEIGAPDWAALPTLSRVAFRAVRLALGPETGPVHINARFRKPLEPTGETVPSFASATPLLFVGEHAPSVRALSYLWGLLAEAERPLVVLGPLHFSSEARAVHEQRMASALRSLAGSCHLPVAAEVTSGAHLSSTDGIFSLGMLAEADAFSRELSPDLIIELGSPPVAPAYAVIASKIRRIVVSPRRSPDPQNSAVAFIEADPVRFVQDFAQQLPASEKIRAYCERLRAVAKRCEQAIVRELSAPNSSALGEPAAIQALIGALPDRAVLAVGNSLVVRDLDVYAANGVKQTVLHQRGASGIDGLIAGAVGARLATAADIPVVLLLGDVSAVHDVGSLALLGPVTAPLVIVVIDNGGGRIFDSLPVKRAIGNADLFDRLFVTPPAAFLERTSAAFGVSFKRVADARELTATVVKALSCKEATVIEVTTPHEAGKQERWRVRAALHAAVDEVSGAS